MSPTKMAFLGPNDFLILGVDKVGKGVVQRITNGQLIQPPLASIFVGADPPGCVCGISIKKDLNGTTSVFIHYYIKNSINGSSPVGIYVYKYEFTNNKLEDPQRIFYLPIVGQSIHNGGGIMIGPDNNLYIPVGELDGKRTKAQNTRNGPDVDGSSGILRITENGHPAQHNPLGNDTLLNMYYAYGIRNSFGIDFDPVSGKLWATENGPRYGDE